MTGIFTPVLAGATLRDRLLACLGALVGIGLTGLLCGLLALGKELPLLIASMGASAVLLFAVPTSPMAQPWAIIGGNVLSACAGLLVGALVHAPILSAGLAVALAIVVMSLTRSLHPPGGATALSVVLGGTAVTKWGLLFPLMPVGINCCLLVGSGWLFHRFRKHAYPHVPPVRLFNPMGFHSEDVDAALAKFNETFDIDREDLESLLSEIEAQARLRQKR